MPIRENNYEIMSTSDTATKLFSEINSLKIRFNLELLKGCEFKCPGCYVTRNNSYCEKDLEIVLDAASKFLNEGYDFNEVILGPTDFFVANNTIDIISNPKFVNLFVSPRIFLTIVSTLQTNDHEILKRIDIINENFDSKTCIELLIIFDLEKALSNDQEYIEFMKHKLNLLQNINGPVEYAFQINIQDTSGMDNFKLSYLTKFVREEFGTIFEFNPSFMRSKNPEVLAETLKRWNEMLRSNSKAVKENNEEEYLFTMRNRNHGSFSEITYNFKNGFFYTCPFIYENVFDKSDSFKINPTRQDGFYELNDFLVHRHKTDRDQFTYSNKTEECSNCVNLTSCVGKQILHYMENNNIKSCLLPKDVMD